ncbi:putative secreted lipase [Colletotrichum spinosum]|uniref:Carboxylic ester hydrolase n=1 Tax=Colletotrichum spinosum TaxID=1347390 RepID=A0A4R8QHA4_9PEZI|nr:putative secreted lipase [Colletotrichum spinosum]
MLQLQRLLLLVANSAATCTKPSTQPTAILSSGPIQGISTTLANASLSVNKFLGVPYAAPPVRFALPEPPQPWTRPLNATDFGPACLQSYVFAPLSVDAAVVQQLFNNPPVPESEDCLTLNVFAPATESSTPRAVVVFVPGGGWQIGSGRSDLSAFAAYEDIIAVTLNYRTNIFGFPPSPEIPITERNLGLYDQRLALDWVQQNIASFGGDPSQVTIWGESAGAWSIDYHLKSFVDPPRPFRAAILSSGQTSFGISAAMFPSDGATWSTVAAAVGCADNQTTTTTVPALGNFAFTSGTANDVLDCMRQIPAQAILDALNVNGAIFGPQRDNITVVSQPAERWRTGHVAKVPILTGTVQDEGRALLSDRIVLASFVEAYFPPAFVPQATRDAILATYRADPRLVTEFDVAAAIYTDYVWQCPQAIHAQTAASIDIPTWRYRFNASVLEFLPDELDYLGKFHASDIVLLFSNPATAPFTAQSYAVYEYFRGAIARFVKNPMSGPGWAAVGSGFAPLDAVVIGDVGDVPTVVAPYDTTLLDERCSLYRGLYPILGAALG